MRSVVCCSGGGDSPDNEARKVLNSYDGTKEHMRRIVDTMFVDKKWAADDNYINRRWELANLPGAWEATAAARFKAPFRTAGGARSERDNIAYGNIAVPTLVFAGRHDPLRAPGYTDGFVPFIRRPSFTSSRTPGTWAISSAHRSSTPGLWRSSRRLTAPEAIRFMHAKPLRSGTP